MSRKISIYVSGWVPKRDNSEPPSEVLTKPEPIRSQLGAGALWGDRHYDGLRTTEGVDISTRTKHREYMRQTGLTTADDYKSEWKSAAEVRADVFTTGGDHKSRRDDVGRAMYEVQERNRKRGRK